MAKHDQSDWANAIRARRAVFERPGSLDDPDSHIPHVGPEKSGNHSSVYLNSSRLVRDPRFVGRLVSDVWIPALQERKIRPDLIVGYVPYTNDLAFAVATALDTGYAWTGRGDKVDSKGNTLYKTDFPLGEDRDGNEVEGVTAVMVFDDLVSGNSLRRTREVLEAQGVEVVGPALGIGNMSGYPDLDGQEIVAAADFPPEPRMFSVQECRAEGYCHIGSRAIQHPRDPANWAILQAAMLPPR